MGLITKACHMFPDCWEREWSSRVGMGVCVFFIIEQCKVCGERRGVMTDLGGNRIRYYRGQKLEQFISENLPQEVLTLVQSHS